MFKLKHIEFDRPGQFVARGVSINGLNTHARFDKHGRLLEPSMIDAVSHKPRRVLEDLAADILRPNPEYFAVFRGDYTPAIVAEDTHATALGDIADVLTKDIQSPTAVAGELVLRAAQDWADNNPGDGVIEVNVPLSARANPSAPASFWVDPGEIIWRLDW